MARKKKVSFNFRDPGAHEVKLAGNFTNWENGAIFMTRGRSGEWKTQVALEPGEYEYKFVADGQWLPDPAAEEQKKNEQGTENSVRLVR